MQSQNFAGTALIAGKRKKGLNLRAENLHAVMSIANLVRSSFGPMGLDKLLVDDIGEILITNDGATIVDQLDVKHPASKLIIQLTQLQNKEVGDGTTSVVLIAAELVSTALNLIKHGLHPSTIISGYKLASKEAVSFIKREMTHSISQLGDQVLVNIAKTSINSKVLSM
ncbi:t-complex protein 1 subunit alpha [Anaeramoeba flamelloides]|uniref:T-complex protein 1 subunit alpha n=1 Tax=Anaeramoeba flamelloides TaxID=1746091 RepID=A0ABQ8Y833_9EUKA|nr:t-complex protein 1 subunit alpha [Anaeramoeba flamelloides]